MGNGTSGGARATNGARMAMARRAAGPRAGSVAGQVQEMAAGQAAEGARRGGGAAAKSARTPEEKAAARQAAKVDGLRQRVAAAEEAVRVAREAHFANAGDIRHFAAVVAARDALTKAQQALARAAGVKLPPGMRGSTREEYLGGRGSVTDRRGRTTDIGPAEAAGHVAALDAAVQAARSAAPARASGGTRAPGARADGAARSGGTRASAGRAQGPELHVVGNPDAAGWTQRDMFAPLNPYRQHVQYGPDQLRAALGRYGADQLRAAVKLVQGFNPGTRPKGTSNAARLDYLVEQVVHGAQPAPFDTSESAPAAS